MPRLSLCMIVRNEERFLAGALESAVDPGTWSQSRRRIHRMHQGSS
jgi:hypothetical protein